MKKFLVAIAILLALLVVAVALVGWWYLRSDTVTAPDLPGVTETGSLLHADIKRTWMTYVPASKAERPALLLLLHGSRGDGRQMQSTTTYYRFNELAERHGFLAVYPDGYLRHWNDCRANANYEANLENIDDVGFLRTLAQLMAADHGVDLSRVYVAGMSNGGHMAFRMGFEAPDLVSGIAAVGASLPVEANLDCARSGRPVAAMIMNGTADPVNPYDGGLVEVFGDTSRGDVLASADSARYWADLAGYKGDGVRRELPQQAPDDGTSVAITRWSGEGRVPVELVSIPGGGHTFPDPVFNLPRILGPTSHELSGAEVIWSFFAEAEQPAP